MSLKCKKQFCSYRLEPRNNGKMSKIPTNIKGENIDIYNAPLYTYDEVVDKNGYVGFVFRDTPVVGIDLDDYKEYIGLAKYLVKLCNSYTEVSQSGNGLHILLELVGAPKELKYSHHHHVNNKIQFYYNFGYFLLTGNMFTTKTTNSEYDEYLSCMPVDYYDLEEGDLEDIEDASPLNKLNKMPYELFNFLFSPSTIKNKNSPSVVTVSKDMEVTDSDLFIIRKMLNAKSAPLIKALYTNDLVKANHLSGNCYPSHSEADLALCSYICYYADKDKGAAMRIYLSSDLWEHGTGKSKGIQYAERTIQKASETT